MSIFSGSLWMKEFNVSISAAVETSSSDRNTGWVSFGFTQSVQLVDFCRQKTPRPLWRTARFQTFKTFKTGLQATKTETVKRGDRPRPASPHTHNRLNTEQTHLHFVSPEQCVLGENALQHSQTVSTHCEYERFRSLFWGELSFASVFLRKLRRLFELL